MSASLCTALLLAATRRVRTSSQIAHGQPGQSAHFEDARQFLANLMMQLTDAATSRPVRGRAASSSDGTHLTTRRMRPVVQWVDVQSEARRHRASAGCRRIDGDVRSARVAVWHDLECGLSFGSG